MLDPNQKSPVKEVIDNAKTKAFQRGAKKADWNDVWASLAEHREFNKVLAQRGVMVSGFLRDLQFATKFGLKGGEPVERPFYERSSMLDQVYQDLSDQVHNYIRENENRPDTNPLTKQVSSAMLLEILQREIRKLHSEDTPDPVYLKTKELAISTIVREVMEAATMLAGSREQGQAQIAALIQKILVKKMYVEDEDAAITVLEEMDAHPLEKPSALDVIDMVTAISGSFYQDLLHRNGLLTDDPEKKDTLADRFPGHIVQEMALDALNHAYAMGSKQVDRRHIALALMGNTELQMHLHELGIKDLLDFSEKFEKAAFKAEKEAESGIRVHPKVSDEFKAFLYELDAFCAGNKKDDHLPSKLLRRIFTQDKGIDTALNKAGLLRRMSRGWAKPYDEDAKKGKKDDSDDDKKKKDKPFEISDKELEALIAEYCTDYTRLAAKRKFDPMIGNEDVMEQIETTLLKRGKKNPIVIGDPGTGKSKILEGYAQRIVSGKVPKKLIGSRLLSLDLHSINTSPFVGVFESRILPIVKGISERNASGKLPPIQLGIDEFGNAMDAGAHSKGEGARALLKPYFASGDLFVLANTTMNEWQTKVKKDGAMARRFTPVVMKTKTEKEAADILQQLQPRYSKHHGIRIPKSMPAAVANFAERYIHGVNHPDKSLDLFDLACAMAVKEGAKTLDMGHLVKATSSMSNVPEEFLKQNDKKRYATLPENLGAAILEQPEAVGMVSAALQRAKAGLRANPEAPIGNFLFVGPTGVGKTELTRALTRLLFGSEDFLNRFDMSEYMERHSAARLIGTDPGMANHDEGGQLIRAVQQKPYSVNLFDEVEKAHQDVYNVLLRPFESGIVTDGRGQQGNMRNTINIMTTNIGAMQVMEEGARLGLNPLDQPAEWQEMARPIYEREVARFFKPEFLNRLDGVIYFNSLSRGTIELLTDRQIEQARAQVRENQFGLEFELAKVFRDAVAQQGFDVRYGARPLKRAWNDIVATPLAQWLLIQDDRKLKRAAKIEIIPGQAPFVDYDAKIDEAISKGGNLSANIREVAREYEASQVAKPEFKLILKP